MSFETLANHARRGRRSEYLKFTPRKAIELLLGDSLEQELERAWALSCLLFWAISDPYLTEAKQAPDQKFYSREARRGGNLFLLRELHESLGQGSDGRGRFRMALRLMMITEGFANAIVGYPAKTNFDECKENMRDVVHAVALSKYLMQTQKHLPDRCNLKYAKLFLRARPPGEVAYSNGTIQGIWDKYRRGAPLLCGFFEEGSFDWAMFDDFDAPFVWAIKMSRDPTAMRRAIGVAASVSDTIGAVALKSSPRDFEKVERYDPNWPLSEEDVSFIKDLDSPTEEDDGSHYRAGMIPTAR